jgi:N-acyl-L-homoserine lactone synthetase
MTNSKAFRPEHWLSTRIVTHPQELHRIYRLRYSVYCEERAFLPTADYPEGLERDDYDPRAKCFAAFDRDDEVAGSVRLVLDAAGAGFPFQRHCPLFENASLPPSHSAGEVSRLVLNQRCRTPPGGGDTGTVILTVYREMYQYSLQQGVDYWYAAMERPLVRMLSRIGVEFERIGPSVDYHGPVAPYLLELSALQRRLAQVNPTLLHWLDSTL